MTEKRVDKVTRFATMHSQARVKAGKSQEYMALELGVSRKTVQNWEKGLSSPSFFQSLEWFGALNVNPFPYYIRFIYYDTDKSFSDDKKIDKAFNALIRNLPTNDKKALLYLYYGEHGSSPHSVIQLMLAHLHTPITSRVANAYLISRVYELDKQLNNIICPDMILPDMEDLNDAILKARDSALKHEYGYMHINKEEL